MCPLVCKHHAYLMPFKKLEGCHCIGFPRRRGRDLYSKTRHTGGNALQPTESSPVSSSSSKKVLPSSPVCLCPERTRMWDTLHHRKSAKMMPRAADTGMNMSGNRWGRVAPWECHSMVAILRCATDAAIVLGSWEQTWRWSLLAPQVQGLGWRCLFHKGLSLY